MSSGEQTILVVDDDPQVLEYISALLKSHQHSVIGCTSAEEAMEQLECNSVAVVVTDIVMPNMSGIELLATVHGYCPEKPVILMTGFAEVDTAIEAIDKGAFRLIRKPFRGEVLVQAVEKAMKYVGLAEQGKNYMTILENALLRKTRELEDIAIMASKMSMEVIQRLSAVAEFRDVYTGAHTSRIGLYSKKIAEVINMNRDFIEKIATASSLHDIGKIGISDDILLKKGPLSGEEFTIMKEHTTMGSRILINSSHPVIQMASSIALNHHERWNGGGYPQGLKRNQIPIEARIVKLVDEYDALRSERPYKPSFSHKETFRVLTEGDGRSHPDHFDPEVLDAFKKVASSFDEIFNACQDYSQLHA